MLDSVKFAILVFSLAYSGKRCRCEQRLCPGVGGRRCEAFMSPIFRDPHPTCVRYRGTKGSADVTCDICKGWSVAQWEAFLKRRPYSERRKKRPSGSTLPSAPPPILPSDSSSSEAGRPASPPQSLPPPCEGVTVRGRRKVSPGWVLVRSPLPPFRERGGRGVGFCGCERFGCFLLPGGGSSGIIALTGVACAH